MDKNSNWRSRHFLEGIQMASNLPREALVHELICSAVGKQAGAQAMGGFVLFVEGAGS